MEKSDIKFLVAMCIVLAVIIGTIIYMLVNYNKFIT